MSDSSNRPVDQINAGVVGLGWMGRNHARVYDEIPSSNLAGVADISESATHDISQKYGCVPYKNVTDLLSNENLDVISVAVSTPNHFSVALEVIEAGVNVLVEKPITTTVEDAQKLIDAAQANDVVLGVGHIERFNPVIRGLKTILDTGEIGRILQVSIRRIGPSPDRDRGAGVFLDLATHDVDITRFLTGSEVKSVASLSANNNVSKYEDLGAGLLGMEDGSIAIIIENWVSPIKIREIAVTGDKGMLVADTLTQDLFQYDNDYKLSEWAPIQTFRGMSEGRMVRHRLTKGEPLRLQLESLVQSVITGTPFGIPGQDGLLTLATAIDLRDNAANRRD
jgi:UDP-N-acetylglucosamine 3-dehydrogenase